MFFFVCFSYIIDAVCFCIWYQFIYQNSNVTLFKLLRNVQRHFRIHLQYIFFKRSRDLSVFFKSYSLNITNVKKKQHTQRNKIFETTAANENLGASQKTNLRNEFKSFQYLFTILFIILIWVAMSSIFAAIIIHVSFIQKIIYTVFDIFFVFSIFIKYERQISIFLDEYIIFFNTLLRMMKYQSDKYKPF